MALHTASTMKGIKDHRNTLKIKSKISNKSVDPFALTIFCFLDQIAYQYMKSAGG